MSGAIPSALFSRGTSGRHIGGSSNLMPVLRLCAMLKGYSASNFGLLCARLTSLGDVSLWAGMMLARASAALTSWVAFGGVLSMTGESLARFPSFSLLYTCMSSTER